MIAYRDIADTEAMIDAAAKYRHAVVIGGGLLGLEAANGLKLRGMDVTVVHLMPWLMERQLDRRGRQAAAEVARSERGLKFRLGAQTEALVGGEAGRVAAVRFKDGDEIAGRPGRDGGRHPPQHRAGRRRRAALQPRHRRQRHACRPHRPAHLRGRRMRRASRHRLRPGGAAVRAGQGLRQPPGRSSASAATAARQTSTKLKVTGIDLFSAGDFSGGEGTRGDRAVAIPAAASTRSW